MPEQTHDSLWNECFGGDLSPYPSDDEGDLNIIPGQELRRSPRTRKKKLTKPTTAEKPAKKQSTKRTARKESEARKSREVKKKREKTRIRRRRRRPRRSQFDETYGGRWFRSDGEVKAHPSDVVFTNLWQLKRSITFPAMAWTRGKDGRLMQNPNVRFLTPRAEGPEESIEMRWMRALREDKREKDDYVARMNIDDGDDDDDDDVEPQSCGQRLGPEGTVIID